MKKHLPKLLIFFTLFSANQMFAQSNFSHEAGISFGVTSFQTDFGERYDFPSANASDLGFSLVYYLNFFGREYNWRTGSTFFSEHFKLKAEFLYANKTNIKHEPWVGLSEESPTFAKLDAMRGNIKFFNVGTQLEYYFFSLDEYSVYFGQQNQLNPYLSAGVHYAFYDPKVTSTLNPFGPGEIGTVEGDVEPYDYLLGNSAGTSKEWKWTREAVHNDPGNAFGVSVGAGLRYNMQYFSMVLDARWQHFFSDKVDGLDAPDDPGNKYNDTMIYVNLGVVYTFNRY